MLDWFNNIKNKSRLTFIEFDIVEFYPSISAELLNDALQFASKFTTISEKEMDIITHVRKSVLFSEGSAWGKKTTGNLFDVTMGSFDGAEACELIGTYMLHQISKELGYSIGLYRDDGLGVTAEKPQKAEALKKQLCSIFRRNGLRITATVNNEIANFLDVSLNLTDGSHKVYRKPNNIPQYINIKSNHPPSILNNIPAGINKRLATLSSNQAAFSSETEIHQNALKTRGHKHQLTYNLPHQRKNTPKNRRRNILWYNPPYSRNVANNIGRSFLQIIDAEFPKDHRLRKLFNRNNVKISYSCMNNIGQTISAHNTALLQQQKSTATARECNCRDRNSCPLEGKCLTTSIIYQASVTTNDGKPTEHYIGLTDNTFKTRYTNHKTSFTHANKKNSTELSKHVWKLKEANIDYNIKWSILKQASSYNTRTKKCNLCLWEKFFIIRMPHISTLNKRNELLSKCRHSAKFLLSNHKT